jgi:hypothetical protein
MGVGTDGAPHVRRRLGPDYRRVLESAQRHREKRGHAVRDRRIRQERNRPALQPAAVSRARARADGAHQAMVEGCRRQGSAEETGTDKGESGVERGADGDGAGIVGNFYDLCSIITGVNFTPLAAICASNCTNFIEPKYFFSSDLNALSNDGFFLSFS